MLILFPTLIAMLSISKGSSAANKTASTRFSASVTLDGNLIIFKFSSV